MATEDMKRFQAEQFAKLATPRPAKRSLYATAWRAAYAMKKSTEFSWDSVAEIAREKAGRARTNRGLVRLMKVAVCAEIHATADSVEEIQARWSAYARAS